MAILVINAGSSSVKFTLFGSDGETVRAAGIVERIGIDGTRLKYRGRGGQALERLVPVANAEEAMGTIIAALTDKAHGMIGRIQEIAAVGHRVVHGGETLTQPTVIDDQVKSIIFECCRLAPLHNPPNLAGIKAGERLLPDAVQVAVFDTAFHATIPPHAFLYGIPQRYYTRDHIRRYGFHGISHKYVSEEAGRFLGLPVGSLRMITCHLGNGCSMTAVQGGRSIDTSMGFTPLEGLVMGTRCGDIDPAAVLHLMEQYDLSPADMNDLLNKQSGLLALAGIGSNDLRDVVAAAAAGNRQADLTLEIFCYRIRKTIGAFTAAMGRTDVLVFTAGIGENSPEVRQRVCEELDAPEGFGIVLDAGRNAASDQQARAIHADTSRVKVLVIPTNEEMEIARETLQTLSGR
ncbi:MAG: acetate/propionate family kinase [Hyphomicrobiales bacterium]